MCKKNRKIFFHFSRLNNLDSKKHKNFYFININNNNKRQIQKQIRVKKVEKQGKNELIDELNDIEQEDLESLGLRRISYLDYMKDQKTQTLQELREIKKMKILSNQYHNEQEEKMNLVADKMKYSLKNMKKGNEELAEAYYYDTKKATSKITAGTTSNFSLFTYYFGFFILLIYQKFCEILFK